MVQPWGFIADITTEYKPIGPTTNSTFVLGKALEVRVDLRDVGLPESFNLTQIRVMVGECCELPAWRAADDWNPGSTPVVNEIDPPRLVSDEPQYVLARRFQLPEGFMAERLFAPSAPNLTGIARSASGIIYLQHGGLSAGISTLDMVSGEVTRILDLPLAGAGYSSIVGGSDDTAFIPVGDEIWQVHSDGSYEVWGQQFDGQVKCFTFDGRLLGYSHDMTRVIELKPDGSSNDIATGFVQIYDIVAAEDGTIFVSDNKTGNITRFDPDGTHHVLAEHVLYLDPLDLAIDPSGNLFLNSVVSGFVRVDRNNGAFTHYNSAQSPCTIHPADFEFAETDRVLFIDPTWSTVTWADLKAGKNGMFVSNQGANTFAADIGPDGALYIGTWGCDEIPAQIIRISDDGLGEIYIDGLQGVVDDIAFSADGGLYIATHTFGAGTPVFYVTPWGGSPVQVPGVEGLSSLAVDSQSGNILGARGGSLHQQTEYILEFSSDGLVTRHAVQLPKAPFDFILDTAPDGTVYTYASELARQQTGPVVERWVLQLDLENGSSEVVFQYDRQGCCVMGNMSVDSQGNIWWLVDPENIIYEVTPDRVGTIFAQNLPIDSAAVVVDNQGDIYFTSPSGIYRIYREP